VEWVGQSFSLTPICGGKLKTLNRSQVLLRGSAALLLLFPALPALARVHKSDAWARSQFENAETMREALNERPGEERSRHEYQNVINAYRRVYLGAPSSGKADPSLVAVAQLLMEMGRQFDDPGLLRSSVRHYEFLRREYPGSKERIDALLTIGEIYKDDLHDTLRANEVFEEFLRRYSHSALAEEARANLAQSAELAAMKSPQRFAAKSPEMDANRPSEDKLTAGKASEKGKKATEDQADAISNPQESGASSSAQLGKASRVMGVQHWTLPDYTRVAIELDQDTQYTSQRITDPDRVFFDLLQTKLSSALQGKAFDVDDGVLKKIRLAQYKPGQARIVLEVEDHSDYRAFLVSDPPRLIIEVHNQRAGGNRDPRGLASLTADRQVRPALNQLTQSTALLNNTAKNPPDPEPSASQNALFAKTASRPAPKKTIVEADDDADDVVSSKVDARDPAPFNKRLRTAPPANSKALNIASNTATGARRKLNTPVVDVREARPTAGGDRSLIRALGLKIGKIVIDPGHGGHDTGTIGPNGLEEKDLVLDVSRRLGKLLDSRLGAEVVYTRKDDTFIPLETRTSIANQEQADLFVSVHANSSHDQDARGVETYYLNFTSSPQALEVAARENAVSEKSIHELQDLVKKIALKEKIEESHEFASDVQQALHTGLAAKNPGIRDRGVKKAPFIVLIGANMPSILAEISFVSNPGDERHLASPQYRQRIAESLYRGISKYVNGLSGVKVASRIDRATGQ
jgi:N-acetylmuramoyl-L-alanine amidase